MSSFKKIADHWKRRYERFYRGRFFHLTVDIALLTVVIVLTAVFLALRHFQPALFTPPNWQHQEKVAPATSTVKEKQVPKKTPTNLSAKAAVYYNSPQGDQLGSGPIPPIVGLPTTYWLFFKVENSGNTVGDFVMSAVLPSNVTFTGNKTLSAGSLSYSSARHLLIWKISQLPAEKTLNSAGVEIELTPTKAQVGKYCPLADNIRYGAYDQEAEIDLSGSLKDMTSALDFDRINQGQGKVVPLE